MGDDLFAVRFRSDDRETFGLLVESLKSFIPAPSRAYRSGSRRWAIDAGASDDLDRWLAYVRELVPGIEVDRIGARPPKRAPRTATDPFAVLHLRETAPPELVKAAFKCLALLNHPDRGGDHAAMIEINEAYKRLSA